MNGARLARLFERIGLTMDRNLVGITDEASLRTPEGGGNCMNWVLGHILHSRGQVLLLLGHEPRLEPERTSVYGWEPLADPTAAIAFNVLVAECRSSNRAIVEWLRSADAVALDTPVPESRDFLDGPVDTVGAAVEALLVHEAYHGGQLGVLRYASGRTGAL